MFRGKITAVNDLGSTVNPSGNKVETNSTDAQAPICLDETFALYKQNIIGPDITGWRNIFYVNDPFLAEQYIRDSRGFNNFNIFYGILFKIIIVVYVVYIIMEYLKAQPTTTFSLSPTINMKPLNITISTSCSSKWGCYNWTATTAQRNWANPANYHQWKPITVEGYYNFADSSNCNQKNFRRTVRSAYAQANISFVVCYSPSFTDGVVLSVPFSSDYSSSTSLNVRVQGPNYANNMQYDININSGQIKIIYLSQQQLISYGNVASATYEPYVADLFYNGHSSTSMTNFTFMMQQFGYTRVQNPTPTFLSLLGVIGGFVEFSFPIIGFAKGISEIIYKCFRTLQESAIGHRYSVFLNPPRAVSNKAFDAADMA